MSKRLKLGEINLNVNSMPLKSTRKKYPPKKDVNKAIAEPSGTILPIIKHNVIMQRSNGLKKNILANKVKKKVAGAKDMNFTTDIRSSITLSDSRRNKWNIGDFIGKGGFAVVHNAIPLGHTPATLFGEKEFAVKIEPKSSGPLFVECSFYRKVVQTDLVLQWLKKRNKKFIGLCYSLGFGIFEHQAKEYRFIIIPKLKEMLTDLWLRSRRRFHISTVLQIGLHLIDVFQYIHEQGFVHADLKESNMMTEIQESSDGFFTSKRTYFSLLQLYLIDFGLASQYMISEKHRPFKIDPKAKHDGTIEYCSLDSHDGVASSRRSDLQILIFFLLRLYTGYLPWEKFISNKDLVAEEKRRYWRDFPSLIRDCLLLNPIHTTQALSPTAFQEDVQQCSFFMKLADHVRGLEYESIPDYRYLYGLMEQALSNYCQIKSSLLIRSLKKILPNGSRITKNTPSFDGFTIHFRPHIGEKFLPCSETIASVPLLNAKKRPLRRSSVLSSSVISTDASGMNSVLDNENLINTSIPIRRIRKKRV